MELKLKPMPMLRITAYNTTKYMTMRTYIAEKIDGQEWPDEMSAEDRAALQNSEMESMCNFRDETGNWYAIPWQFIVEIRPIIQYG